MVTGRSSVRVTGGFPIRVTRRSSDSVTGRPPAVITGGPPAALVAVPLDGHHGVYALLQQLPRQLVQLRVQLLGQHTCTQQRFLKPPVSYDLFAGVPISSLVSMFRQLFIIVCLNGFLNVRILN